MSEHFKYYGIRLLVLAVIIVLGSVIYQFTIYPQKLEKEGWLKDLVSERINKKSDIYYFSSSPNHAAAPYDTAKTQIGEFIQEALPHRTISIIDTSSIHAGIFIEILKRLPEEKLPKEIIMNLNIRSFGAHWMYSDLENSLQRNLAYWNENPGIINHLNIALKNYNYTSPGDLAGKIEHQKRLEQLPLPNEHSTINRWIYDLKKLNPENKMGPLMVDNFAFVIDKKNKMLGYFSEVVSWSKSKGIPITFVILPEDLNGMEAHVGKQLVELVKENKQFLINFCKTKNVRCVDLCNTLESKFFFENHPTEHYNLEGRQFVGKSIASFISPKTNP